MRKKSLFNASFEESLMLEDDGFQKLHKEQHDKTAKHFSETGPSFWFRIRCLILTLIFPVGANFFILVISMVFHDSETLRLPISSNSLLTVNVFLILLLIWLLLVLIGKLFRAIYLLPYRYQFHVFTFMIWFCVEMDLVAIDLLLPVLSIWGVVAVLGLIAIFSYLMLISQTKRLRKLMYGITYTSGLSDKIANFIAVYGTGILAIGVIIKFILSMFSIEFSISLQLLGLFLTWMFINIATVATVIFIGGSYFLQAYYKWKYPEEYRQWEGKGLEEWYGEKYLKKHGGHFKNGKI